MNPDNFQYKDGDEAARSDRFREGAKQLNNVFPGAGNIAMNSIESIAPFFKQYVVESFGDFFSRRDALTVPQRELAVIASLATLGHAQPQLEFHVKAALNVGCTAEEIAEVITTVSLYAGVPAALNSLRTAAKVIQEEEAMS